MFQVVEEMRREPELDMASVLEVFRDHDERVRGFLEKGTATHCGTLQKCFAPKILGKAACWHVAPYGHIMTYYGEKNSKKANL